MVPDLAGQNGGGDVEGDQSNPDAHPASNLRRDNCSRHMRNLNSEW